jgi:hypothetical protein
VLLSRCTARGLQGARSDRATGVAGLIESWQAQYKAMGARPEAGSTCGMECSGAFLNLLDVEGI